MSNVPVSPVVELRIPDQVIAEEGFEGSGAPYAFTTTNGGSANWAPTTTLPYYGAKSLESGSISNGQFSDLNCFAPAGSTKVRLWHRLNAGSSDLFRVNINDVLVLEVVNLSDWAQFEWPVTEGTKVTLRYIRNVGGGSNAAWVDQVQFLADAWVDITDDCRLTSAHSGGGISIKRGRPNESPIAEPTECDLVINNRSGKYSELNPASEYYGKLGRNQPVRVSIKRRIDTFNRTVVDGLGSQPDWEDTENQIHAGDAYTIVGGSTNFDVTPGAATVLTSSTSLRAFAGTYSDVDVLARVKVSTRDTAFGLILRSNAAGTEYVRVHVTPGGTDQIQVSRIGSINGWTFSANLSSNFVADTWYWMRGQITGRRYRVKFWKDGEAQPTAWGRSYVDDRGPADGDLAQTGGAGMWVRDGTGTVTYSRLEVNVWRTHTEVVSFPTKFDLSRTDRWVTLLTRGMLRRLGQGRKNLDSAMTHHLKQYSAVSPMWYPLESTEGGSASNAVAGGYTALVSGISNEAPDLSGAKRLPGVAGVAHLTEDTSFFTGRAFNYNGSARAWTCLLFFQLDSLPASEQLLFTFTTTGTGRTFKVFIDQLGDLRVDIYASDSVTLLDSDGAGVIGLVPDIPVGSWISTALYVFDSGGTVSWAWNIHRPEPDFPFYTLNGTYSGSAGLFRTVSHRSNSVFTAAGGLRLAQVFAYPGDFPFVNAAFADAASAYDGETNVDRFSRLCDDAGIAYSIIDGTEHEMGPQLPGKLLDHLEDCAGAGANILEEDRDELALVLRTRSSIYNGPVFELDVDAGHLSSPLDPAPDDQQTRNDVVVSRPNGGFARSVQYTGSLNVNPPEEDPQGVGTYDEANEINFYEDAQLQAAADWRRSRGTLRVPRYPGLTLDLTAEAYMTDPALTARALAIDSGTLVSVRNPEVSPDVLLQVVQGYDEFIDQYDHLIKPVTTPGDTFKVGVSQYTTRVAPSGIVVAKPYVVGTDTVLMTRPIDSTYVGWEPTHNTGTRSGDFRLNEDLTTTETIWDCIATSPGDMFNADAISQFVQVGTEICKITAVGSVSGAGPYTQQLTCTRSINGVVTTQLTNAPVALARFSVWVGGVQLGIKAVVSTGPDVIQSMTVASTTPENDVETGFTIPAGTPVSLAEPWRVAW